MPLAHAYTSTLIREAMPSHRRKACNLIRAMAEDLEMPTTCSSAALYIYHAYRSRREDSSEATTSNDSSSSHPKVAVEVHAQRTHGPSPSLFVQTAWLCGLLTHHTHHPAFSLPHPLPYSLTFSPTPPLPTRGVRLARGMNCLLLVFVEFFVKL